MCVCGELASISSPEMAVCLRRHWLNREAASLLSLTRFCGFLLLTESCQSFGYTISAEGCSFRSETTLTYMSKIKNIFISTGLLSVASPPEVVKNRGTDYLL